MIREVARTWNYDESEMAVEGFDPLVGLLVGAFATGLEGLHHELQNSRTRIVQRLAQLLTPEVMTGPRPAHAVMRTNVVDPVFEVLPTHSFSCNAGGKEVHFSAAGSFALINAKLKTFVIQNKVRAYGTTAKESFLNQVIPENSGWIGLELDPELTAFEDFLLFFDWRNDPLRSTHLEQVAGIRVFLGDTELDLLPGLPDIYVPGEQSLSHTLHDQVRRYYNRHFLSISSRTKTDQQPISLANCRSKYPDELSQFLTAEESAKLFSTELVWLKLQFPVGLREETTYRVQVEVNAFPVVNRKRCIDTHELRPFFNIFPIRVENQESFLELIDVETASGQLIQPAQQITSETQHQYVLRKGGVTRFDERDSYDIIAYLLTLLRDESAMFMSLGRSELESEVEEIRKRLEKINTAIGQGNDQHLFLTVKTPEKNGRVTVRFWSTNGESANRIPFGTKLSKERGQLFFTDDESVLLTTTTGARQQLKVDENLPAFRQALLTRGRLVTVEDIKAVCFAELGDRLLHVSVSKGLMTGATKTQGLMRTIDVQLKPNPKRLTTDEEWDEYCHLIKQLIEKQSFLLTPYRVLVVK